MQDIPFIKIEEHHEAFLVWHDAIKKKFLPQKGNAARARANSMRTRIRADVDILYINIEYLYNEMERS
jgi:hypothetical protein